MMTIDKRNYSLAVQEEEITVFRNGERYFDLPIRSAVPADGNKVWMRMAGLRAAGHGSSVFNKK